MFFYVHGKRMSGCKGYYRPYANREAISGSDHLARHRLLYETVTHFKLLSGY